MKRLEDEDEDVDTTRYLAELALRRLDALEDRIGPARSNERPAPTVPRWLLRALGTDSFIMTVPLPPSVIAAARLRVKPEPDGIWVEFLVGHGNTNGVAEFFVPVAPTE